MFEGKIDYSASRGFTLIEMLAVIVIFVIVGSIIMSILVTSFRTAQKTDIITLIQHNGNYAVLQISKVIRDARGLVNPFPCYPNPITQSSVTILTPDNQQVTFACGGSPTTIASNGASLLDTSAVSLQSCSFTCSQDSDSGLPVISIDFSLMQKASTSFVERIASQSAIDFHTTIGVRNINR